MVGFVGPICSYVIKHMSFRAKRGIPYNSAHVIPKVERNLYALDIRKQIKISHYVRDDV